MYVLSQLCLLSEVYVWGTEAPGRDPPGFTPSSADFDVILDEEISKEGKQSLRFDVRRCSAKGGSRSPGLTNEFSQIGKYPGEGRYKVSFWIRNAGTEFAIKAGGVSATAGDMRTLIREDQNIEEWQLQEYEIEVAKDRWLRMELNIYQPGSFWIDDIRIERVQ